ncbi:uncharacterized protein LOC116195909 [Punica granatum]|uniref:DUF538 domain-containing protein n=2 Tax=Punica granatum TaxID=22663 RepID=A0A218X967_PUNGR|nr:uncharacterized protein LOC116195909 [Punica granatum]OWM81454.1 hypothetical protein CDL15_Pgr007492 [Punica granatum]PKI49617.1 hypothetical protein CRG98_030007 [Punica granatum]
MAEKEGAEIKKGAEGLKWAISLYEEFGFPAGLMPFTNVVEAGLVRSTGYWWVTIKKKMEHKFKKIGRLIVYDREMSGYIKKNRLWKLNGVKAKEPLFSAAISEITVDDPPTGNIRFKSIWGITLAYPIDAFDPNQ